MYTLQYIWLVKIFFDQFSLHKNSFTQKILAQNFTRRKKRVTVYIICMYVCMYVGIVIMVLWTVLKSDHVEDEWVWNV